MTVVETPGLVRSSLLAAVPGIGHGFTTRERGSMAGSVYPAQEQERNRRELERALGMPLVKPSQVHSSDVALVEGGWVIRLRDGERRPLERARELAADALITREPGVALAVAVADCVPVLVVAGEWIGIAHAGWEGTAKRVVQELAAALASRGADLDDARAAIGPSIGPCCYDIDAARAERIREALRREGDRALYPRGDRVRFDLWLANRMHLRRRGINVVDSMDVCAKDHVDRYFSHRGEQGRAGRGLAFIGWSR